MTGVAIAPAEGQLSVVVGPNPTAFPVQVGQVSQTNVPEGADVLICQTPDGGEIDIRNGLIERTDTPEVAVYLSLFGGNDYWANLDETEPDKQYTAETGELLDTLVPSSANLKRVEDAVRRDLAWLGVDVRVEAFIPSLGRVNININLEPGTNVTYEENWSATR